MVAKAYCECKFKENAYFGLVGAGETKESSIQWVHWPCGKPTEMVWRAWLKRCPECWAAFSSPWSPICKGCHQEAHGTSVPFRGWAWGRKVHQEFHEKLLASSRAMRYSQEVASETPHASEQPPRLAKFEI